MTSLFSIVFISIIPIIKFKTLKFSLYLFLFIDQSYRQDQKLLPTVSVVSKVLHYIVIKSLDIKKEGVHLHNGAEAHLQSTFS